MARILLIDDMKGVRDSLEVVLSAEGHSVDMAENGQVGIDKLSKGEYDLVITDILMPEKDGTEVVIAAKSRHPNMPIMAVSAGGGGIDANEALTIASGKADKVLEKPFSKQDIIAAIQSLLE